MYIDKYGFIFTDALISIVIVSISVLLVSSLVIAVIHSNDLIDQSTIYSNDEYETMIQQIESCEITCIEETADTSLNNY